MRPCFLPYALALFLAPALFAQDYEIRLARVLKAGDQLKISSTVKVLTATTTVLNDAAPAEQKREVVSQFDGTEKVLEVDSAGRPIKAELTVDKFTRTADGVTADIAPKGAVISCSADGKKRLAQIDGKEVEPRVAMAAAAVGNLGDGGPTDDEAFGTKEKKKKGDSWDINADLTKKLFSDLADAVSELGGKATLDDAGGDALKISVSVTGKIKPPLPEGVTLDNSLFEVNVHGSYPVDATQYIPRQSVEIISSFLAHGDSPSGKMAVKTTMSITQERSATVVK